MKFTHSSAVCNSYVGHKMKSQDEINGGRGQGNAKTQICGGSMDQTQIYRHIEEMSSHLAVNNTV